jgi:hypothetical protein
MSQLAKPNDAQIDQVAKGNRVLETVGRVSAYLPIFLTSLLLLLQNFFPSVLTSFTPTTGISIVGISIVGLVWHIEKVLLESTKALREFSSNARTSLELGARAIGSQISVSSTDTVGHLTQLGARVKELERIQEDFIGATAVLSPMDLPNAFKAISDERPIVSHLRIIAISSQQVLSFFQFHKMRAERCEILLRSFAQEDTPNRPFREQIRLCVSDWRKLEREGKIKSLTVRRYNFHPTEYECIFDDTHLILGLYDSDPADYSGVKVRDPFVIRNRSDAGRLMITEFIRRFDRLMEVCATHHGLNDDE